ncbi:ParA family protein [Roseateles sp. DAIF2]|uniref:ParA family protein n=1 Tax=Roseateles sp. DAIF2 TaxID=2714952 RepID=UPI0018A26436|nr:ParA family protein [Roseateles sp. DAIF2]QPF73162.1 ParA family protein [Roseateles sp. DAIF2]
MPVILVANPKGGVGKSTLAGNIAGYYARQGHAVMLGDIDVQQSSRQWLALRPPQLPAIRSWEIEGKTLARPPKGVSHVVLDTPAGLHGKRLESAHGLADKLLIPLQASLFDIQATYGFLQTLQDLRRQTGRGPQLALVGMRTKDGTLSSQHLQQFVQGLDVPVLGMLRDTQNYVQLAARGLTLWDVAPGRVERDLAQWQALGGWLDK